VVVPSGQRDIPAEGVLALYRTAGWWPERTADQVRAVLEASPAVGAWHGQDLIGFARAVTDGILRAYVEDVIVSPGWRGRGVGRALLAGLTEQLRPVPVVTLFCSPDLVAYYEGSSFKKTRQVVMHRTGQLPRQDRWTAELIGSGRFSAAANACSPGAARSVFSSASSAGSGVARRPRRR
jgi:GNAT superfamily N-acetyltransferase